MTNRTRIPLPSPAMTVAALALIAALAGTAIAAPELATSALSKAQVKRIANTQAKKQIARLALGKNVITRVESVQVPDGEFAGRTATCAPGEKMVGGGATIAGTTAGERVNLVSSGPVEAEQDPVTSVPADGTRLTNWLGVLRNEAGASGGPGGIATLNVFAVCSR